MIATNYTSVYPVEGTDGIEPGETHTFGVSIYSAEDWDLSSQEYKVIVQGVVSS